MGTQLSLTTVSKFMELVVAEVAIVCEPFRTSPQKHPG